MLSICLVFTLSLEEENAQIQQRLEEGVTTEGEIAALKTKLSSESERWEGVVAALKQQIEEKEGVIRETEANIETERKGKEEAILSAQEKEASLVSLQEEARTKHDELETLKSEFQSMQEAHKSLQDSSDSKLADLQAQLDALSTEKDSALEQVEQLQAREKELEASLATADQDRKEAIAALEIELEGLKSNAKEANEKNSEQSERVAQQVRNCLLYVARL